MRLPGAQWAVFLSPVMTEAWKWLVSPWKSVLRSGRVWLSGLTFSFQQPFGHEQMHPLLARLGTSEAFASRFLLQGPFYTCAVCHWTKSTVIYICSATSTLSPSREALVSLWIQQACKELSSSSPGFNLCMIWFSHWIFLAGISPQSVMPRKLFNEHYNFPLVGL